MIKKLPSESDVPSYVDFSQGDLDALDHLNSNEVAPGLGENEKEVGVDDIMDAEEFDNIDDLGSS